VWIQLQDNKQWLSLGGQTNNARNVWLINYMHACEE
jgi:hypothetical protein